MTGAAGPGADFFQPLEQSPLDEPSGRTPLPPGSHPWTKPRNVIGEPVSIHFVLARSEEAAVQIQHLIAFPNGFEFQVVAHYRRSGQVWDTMQGFAATPRATRRSLRRALRRAPPPGRPVRRWFESHECRPTHDGPSGRGSSLAREQGGLGWSGYGPGHLLGLAPPVPRVAPLRVRVAAVRHRAHHP